MSSGSREQVSLICSTYICKLANNAAIVAPAGKNTMKKQKTAFQQFFVLVPRRGLSPYRRSTPVLFLLCKKLSQVFESSHKVPRTLLPVAKLKTAFAVLNLVPRRGLEPPHLTAHPPQGC